MKFSNTYYTIGCSASSRISICAVFERTQTSFLFVLPQISEKKQCFFYLYWFFNNGVIVNWTTQALRDTTFTFPLAFTSTNYAFSGTIWIDTVVGISVTKQLTSVKFSSVLHSAWCNSGYIFMGY